MDTEDPPKRVVDIDAILAVPSDIEAAVKTWRAVSTAGGLFIESPVQRAAWIGIGTAVQAHVAAEVAHALRLKRGGCQSCPAAKGEGHKFDCRAVAGSRFKP